MSELWSNLQEEVRAILSKTIIQQSALICKKKFALAFQKTIIQQSALDKQGTQLVVHTFAKTESCAFK